MDHVIGGLLGCLYTTVGYFSAVWMMTGRFPFQRRAGAPRAKQDTPQTPLTSGPERDAIAAATASNWLQTTLPGRPPPPGSAAPDFDQSNLKTLEEKYRRGRKT